MVVAIKLICVEICRLFMKGQELFARSPFTILLKRINEPVDKMFKKVNSLLKNANLCFIGRRRRGGESGRRYGGHMRIYE